VRVASPKSVFQFRSILPPSLVALRSCSACPQFERMMLTASQRKFDLLLFWALDRLSREGIVKTPGYLEQLRGWNIGWRSYTHPFLDTGNAMTNGIVLSVLSAVAQQERITLSERTKAGLQCAGRTLGRRAVSVDLAKVERHRADGLGLRAIFIVVAPSCYLKFNLRSRSQPSEQRISARNSAKAFDLAQPYNTAQPSGEVAKVHLKTGRNTAPYW
jgi:hypothetical protein